MKKMILAGVCLLMWAATRAQESYYGSRIDGSQAMTMEELRERMMQNDKLDAKVTGKVLECCQAKGCWMKIDAGDGTAMRVKFKDYGFFVPKNSAGKTAIMQGVATMETSSVAELRHYAEDAGKPKEEIDRITEPKQQLVFIAEGVILTD